MTELTDAEVELLANRIRDARDKAAYYRELDSKLTDQLRDAKKVGTDETFGERHVNIYQTTTFDEATAALVLSPEQLALVTVTESHISAEKCEKLLPSKVYEQLRKPKGKPTVRVT